MSRVVALLVAAAVCAGSAAAQVYRSVDANGRTVYTDQPPAKEKAVALPGTGVKTSDDLQGEWILASATANGEVVLDEKLIGAQWSFKGQELTVRTRKGDVQVFALKLETGTPKAFTYAPVQPSTERGGTMIYERAGERLRVAFKDGAEGRAVDFTARPKTVVAVLVPKSGAAGPAGVGGGGRDPCALLRKAGIEDFLRTLQLAEMKGSAPGAGSCGLEGPSGAAVTLQLVPAASRAVLDGQRNHEMNDRTNYAVPKVVAEEPALGPGAFTIKRGGTQTTAIALKGETLVMVGFRHAPGEHPRLISFAQRLLATL